MGSLRIFSLTAGQDDDHGYDGKEEYCNDGKASHQALEHGLFILLGYLSGWPLVRIIVQHQGVTLEGHF